MGELKMPMSAQEQQLLPGWPDVESIWPGFTLEALGRIESVHLYRTIENGVVVEIVGSHRTDTTRPLVFVRMMDVRSGRLPELDALWLSEFFIEDLSADQLESIRYYLYTESGTLHVYCGAVETGIVPV
jgi:hypothetical protein